MRIKKSASEISKTIGPKHHFFGYYDKTPWNQTGQLLLSLAVDFIDRLPTANDIAVVGYSEVDNNAKYVAVGETTAWNWQQGCMLQWLPSSPDRCVIFNDRKKGRFVSVLKDISTMEETVLPMPVYAVHPSRNCALTLNFARLHHTRMGYGYDGIDDPFYDDCAPKQDGVYYLDLDTGNYELIISIAYLQQLNHIDSMDTGKHWVNHITFSPSGSRFCFLHRWQLADGKMYTRLYTARIDGTGLVCILDSGGVSHFAWRDDHTILGWGRLPNTFNRIRRNQWLTKHVLTYLLPVYHYFFDSRLHQRNRISGDSYLLIKEPDGSIERVAEDLFDQDGHCSWSPDSRWILTDTYPNKNNYRELILYNYEKDIRIDVGEFYSPPELSGGIRCDLHPRWNRDGTQICIDSAHEGSRQLYVLDVRDILSCIQS